MLSRPVLTKPQAGVRNLSRTFGFILLAAGVTIAVLGAVIGNVNLGATGLAVAAGAGAYLRTGDRDPSRTLSFSWENHARLYKLLNILFLACFVFSLISLRSVTYGRTAGYLIATGVMALVVPLVLLMRPKGNWYAAAALCQILIVSLSLRLSVYYGSSGVMWDLWRHSEIMQDLLTTGRIPLGTGYESFPLMHLLGTETSLVTSLGIKDAVALSTLLFEAFSPVFVFFLVQRLYSDGAGLLCALMLTLVPAHIFWGFLTTPQSLGISLFPLLLYFLYRSLQRFSATCLALAVLLFTAIVLTHSLSSLIIAIAVLGIYLEDKVFQRWQHKSPGHFTVLIPLVFGVILLFHLMSTWVFGFGVESVRDWLQLGYTSAIPNVASAAGSQMRDVWDSLAVYLLLFLAAVGGLWFAAEPRSRFFGIAASAGLLAVMSRLADPLKIFSLHAYRWVPFMMVLVAVPAAIGFLHLANSRRRITGTAITFAVLAVVVASSLTTYNSNDSFNRNLNLGNDSVRGSFKESELVAVEAMHRVSKTDEKVVVDFLVWSKEGNQLRHRVVDPTKFFTEQKLDTVPSPSVVVLRDDLRREPFALRRQENESITVYLDYDPKALLDSSSNFSLFYDVGTAFLYEKSR